MADTGTSFRRAYQAVVDRTPPAPGWDEIDTPPVRRPARRSVPRWLVAAAAAALLLAVLGGGALLGLDGDPGPASTTPAPAAEAPPATAAPTPTAAEAVVADPQPVPLTPRTARASSELAQFEARYLIDGTPRAWNDDSRRGEGAILTFNFAGPVDLDYIVIHNLTDPERFARNYRIAEFELRADGEPVLVATVPDAPGPHPYDVGRRATEVTLGVLEVYPAEPFDGSPPFEELAVAEVEFQGTAAAP